MVQAVILFGKEAENSVSLESLKAPTVFTGKRLRAILRVHHDKRHQRPIFDTVQIVLRGQISSFVTYGGRSTGWQVEKPIVRMSCVKLAEDFCQISSGDPSLILSETSFFFDIPNLITYPLLHGTSKKEAFRPLPPSIRVIKKISSEWKTRKILGVCDIMYHVVAKFFLRGRRVTESKREIILMPIGKIPPPIDPDALMKEYTLSTTSSSGSFWKRERDFTLSISSTEPLAFVIQATTGKSVLSGTDLTLNFTARSVLDGRRIDRLSAHLFTICEIVITLEATTSFQEQEQESVLSLAETRVNKLAILKMTKFKPQIHKMRLGHWRKSAEMLSGSSRMMEWSTTASIKTFIPYDAPRLPSFFSSLVSRRYALDVDIRLGTDLGMPPQKPMKLRIPVQIIHAGLQKGWDNLAEADFEEDQKLPAYVP